VRINPTSALLLAALAGCGSGTMGAGGDDDGGDSGGSYEPPQPIEGEDEVALAWCEALVRCDLYPDVDTCLAAIDVVGPELREAFENGHATYDPDDAAACGAALGAATCEGLSGSAQLEGCGGVWDGTQGDGDDCLSSAECTGGWCDPGDCDPAISCCIGACAEEEVEDGVPVGGDCSIEPCVAEAFCDYQAEPATCRALVGLDGACHEGECSADLYCRITDATAGTGVCSALPAEGEACDPDYPVCARADNWCDPADGTCRRLVAVGETCDEVADNCVPYAWCSPDGVCVARPGEGDPCEDWPPCMGDLECLDDTCVMPPLEDDAGDCD
jgi:hypothetical protein